MKQGADDGETGRGPDLYERVADLVERIFAAPASPSGWERMLEALCNELSPGAVAVLLGRLGPEGPGYLLGHGIGIRRVDLEGPLPSGDHLSAEAVPVGAVIAIPPASPDFASTQMFRNEFAPEGLTPGPGLCVVLGRNAQRITGALLVLSRDPGWEPSEEDRTLLALLAPYLIRGVSLGLRLNERRAGIEALLDIFDALVLGVLLLDERGNLSFANRSAAELLGVAPGLAPTGPGAERKREQLDEAFHALSRRTLAEKPAAHSLAHPVDGRSLHVVVTPLDWNGENGEPNGRFSTALFIGDPGVGAPGARNAFASLYALTPSEERLALELAAGATLAQAARQLGIRLSTARSVLGSVFEKTGTHRQASLVRLVLTTAGQVRLESPRG